MIISGYIPFNQESNYYYDVQGPYRIILHPDCLNRVDLSECFCCVNHNRNTWEAIIDPAFLTMKVTSYGILYEGKMKGLDIVTRAITYDIKNNYYKGSSPEYTFLPQNQQWTVRNGERIQIMKQMLSLTHVSLVRDPAFTRSWCKLGPMNEPILNHTI